MPPSITCSQLGRCSRCDVVVALGHEAPLQLRRPRLLVRRTHVGPHDAAALNAGICLEFHRRRELPRLRQFHALAGDVVFPAVI